MARRRRGRKLDGWLILDKPTGLTSAQAVAAVRRLTGAQKAGHAGTLDPLASGVLPIGLGEATKTMTFITGAGKEYDFTVAWGEARDTDDAEGTVTRTSPVTPEPDAIAAALPSFTGTIDQTPPAFSAIKIAGRRAYDLARGGQAVAPAPRRVVIEALALVDHDAAGRTSRLHVACGKGTYVRALARDLACRLGTCGHVVGLRRTRVGPFDRTHAISLEKLEALSHSARAAEYVLPVMTALADIPALAVTEHEADRLRHGQSLRLPTANDGTVCVTVGGAPVAIADATQGIVQPLRVFNL